MHRTIRLISVLMIALAVLLLASCGKEHPRPEGPITLLTPVAYAGDDPVTVLDVFQARQMLSEPGKNAKDTPENALQEAIYRKFVYQMIPDFHDYDPAEVDRLVRNRVHQPLMEYMFNDLFQGKVEIPDSSVDSFYQANLDSYHRPEQRRATQILISDSKKAWEADGHDVYNLSKVEMERKARERAEELYRQIKNGASIKELAAKYSHDSYTKADSGSLGFFGRNDMVPEFEKPVFALKKGELSKPFKTRFGYHIVKMDEIIPEDTLPLTDDLRDQIRIYLRREWERRQALALLDSLMQNSTYVWNEELLKKNPGQYDSHDWVCIVDGVDTAEASLLSNWELRYRTEQHVPEMTPQDRKDLLKEKMSPEVLMAYAIKSGYYDSDSGKALYKMYFDEEIARRIYRKRTDLDFNPPEEELRAYYDARKDDYQSDKPVKIEQIVFTDSMQAVRAMAELSDSVSFDSLAHKYYPEGSDVKQEAFDLGWISQEELGEPFYNAVWITPVGEVIGPLHTEWGYHLVKVVDRKDLLTFEAAKREIKDTLRKQKREQMEKDWIDWITAGKKTEIFQDIFDQVDFDDYAKYWRATGTLEWDKSIADSASAS